MNEMFSKEEFQVLYFYLFKESTEEIFSIDSLILV